MSASSPVVDSPLIVHRGASALAPENTLAAVRKAAENGARWIETDVRLTRDGGLVMLHDSKLDRTTTGSGPVVRADLADIRALDAGSWFAPEFSGEPVPDLQSFLETVLECGLSLQLELKENPGREEALVAAVATTVKRIWPIGERGLFVSSFSERCMVLSANALPEVPRALATEFVPEDPAGRLAEARCQILHTQAFLTGGEEMARLRSADIEFAVATINDADTAMAFLDAGATSVLTDRVDLFAKG